MSRKVQLQSIQDLQVGDVVVHKTGISYVVTEVFGDTAIGVRTIQISNPSEWDVIEEDLAPEPPWAYRKYKQSPRLSSVGCSEQRF